MESPLEIQPHAMAHGGEAVARSDGKSIFVGGAMPGENVSVEIEKDKGSWARARLIEVLAPSPNRVDPVCPHFDSCGGCQWQYADYERQLEWKRQTVIGQLAHLGKLETDVRPMIGSASPYNYRNRMDFHVRDDQPALYRRKSKELVPLSTCALMVDPLSELFAKLGPLKDVNALTMRASPRTGQSLVTLRGAIPPQAASWGANVARVRRGQPMAEIGRDHMYEEVAGHRFRITANAFFQNNTEGADHLVTLVRQALTPTRDDVLLDGYAGGGLFSVCLAKDVGEIISVEVSPLALGDLETNLSEVEAAASIVPVPFEESIEELDGWTVAVVDPPRTGMGVAGIETVTSDMPRAIAYVSCDPASFARDARMLVDIGYELEWVAPVDMFPQTFHIELVGKFALTEG
jgi:23S rRNA (uracil1939-C5)-methyltransferase